MDHNSNQKRQKHTFLLLPRDKATRIIMIQDTKRYDEYSREIGCEKAAIGGAVIVRKWDSPVIILQDKWV